MAIADPHAATLSGGKRPAACNEIQDRGAGGVWNRAFLP